MSSTTDRVPVTILTGFLGSGKTTLLNRILSENHGRRIAVIENEFGEVGIDHDLVIGAEEEIFEMNNGCICCTVRGDLIRILGNLMKRRDRFDYILIETTGMADPGPVAQTFFVDDDIRSRLQLDGVVTMVDAKHVVLHLDDSDEVKEQIAFADVILLNKIDLVAAEDLDRLEARLRAMNPAAAIHRTLNAEADIDKVLHRGGFDLNRALEIDTQFLEPEYPFEWGGIYALQPGRHSLSLQAGPDPSMAIALPEVEAPTEAALRGAVERAVRLFSDPRGETKPGQALEPGYGPYELALETDTHEFPLVVNQAGVYALFTEHHPDEFGAFLSDPSGDRVEPVHQQAYKPDHEHDDEVSSVGITTSGDLDLERFQAWLGKLLATKGPDIFRMKGVLSFADSKNRFVFQGVHMLFDGRPDRPWGDDPRRNALIFIGRNLDRGELNEGFNACLA